MVNNNKTRFKVMKLRQVLVFAQQRSKYSNRAVTTLITVTILIIFKFSKIFSLQEGQSSQKIFDYFLTIPTKAMQMKIMCITRVYTPVVVCQL